MLVYNGAIDQCLFIKVSAINYTFYLGKKMYKSQFQYEAIDKG